MNPRRRWSWQIAWSRGAETNVDEVHMYVMVCVFVQANSPGEGGAGTGHRDVPRESPWQHHQVTPEIPGLAGSSLSTPYCTVVLRKGAFCA